MAGWLIRIGRAAGPRDSVPQLPGDAAAIVGHAVMLAGSMWIYASGLAAAQHAEVQAAWETRKAEMENELAEE